MNDVTRFPEIMQIAEARKGLDLGFEERMFLEMEKMHVRNSFATYLRLNPAEVQSDDVPIMGFGGSGGGLWALVGVLGYSKGLKDSGLWELFTLSSKCFLLKDP